MWAKHKYESGFTIVELLIVVVVIAILAAITIVSYNGISERAQRTQLTAGVSQWEKILKLYLINGGDTGILLEGTCLSASPSDFPAGGGYSAGRCASGANTSEVDAGMIDLFKQKSLTSIPKTTLSPVNYGGTQYRGLYAYSGGSTIFLLYYLKGSACLVTSDTATANGSAVQCSRAITAPN